MRVNRSLRHHHTKAIQISKMATTKINARETETIRIKEEEEVDKAIITTELVVALRRRAKMLQVRGRVTGVEVASKCTSKRTKTTIAIMLITSPKARKQP